MIHFQESEYALSIRIMTCPFGLSTKEILHSRKRLEELLTKSNFVLEGKAILKLSSEPRTQSARDGMT